MTENFRKNIKLLFFYIIFLMFFIVLVSEVTIRLFRLAPRLPIVRYVKDPHLPFRVQPYSKVSGMSPTNEFFINRKHNSYGFWDIEHLIEKPDGVFRILGLGDSFTYGAGVGFEDTYLFRLEKMLNARGGNHPKIEIIKAGVSRFYPEPERLLLEHYGVKFKPDLILVGFVRNDVIDTFYGIEEVEVSKSGYLITGSNIRQMEDIINWLYIHSHIFRIFMRVYNQYADPLQKVNHAEIYKPNGFLEKEWQKIETEYEKMTELVRKNNSKIVFFNIPQDTSWGKPSSTYPPHRLAEWASRENVPFIDITPAMEKASKTETLYWKIDGHCNSAGYKVIADVLFVELVKMGLVP